MVIPFLVLGFVSTVRSKDGRIRISPTWRRTWPVVFQWGVVTA